MASLVLKELRIHTLSDLYDVLTHWQTASTLMRHRVTRCLTRIQSVRTIASVFIISWGGGMSLSRSIDKLVCKQAMNGLMFRRIQSRSDTDGTTPLKSFFTNCHLLIKPSHVDRTVWLSMILVNYDMHTWSQNISTSQLDPNCLHEFNVFFAISIEL